MGPDALVAIIVPLAMFTVVFGIFYIKSRENLALIEKGINPKNKTATPRPFVSLKYGLLLCGVGLGWLCAYLLDSLVMPHSMMNIADGNHTRIDDNPSLYFALVAIGGGLGLILSYSIEKKYMMGQKNMGTDAEQ